MVLTDGTNNVVEVARRRDGTVVGTFGRAGRNAGEFIGVHFGKFDTKGNLIPAKFLPASACRNGCR